MFSVRPSLKTLMVGAACLPVALHPAHAARIYNQTRSEIEVQAQGFGGHASVPAEARSDSIDWPLANGVSVFGGNNQLCSLGFGDHAQIQGGNYMIVAPASGHTNCGVCDSNHKVIVGTARC